MHKFRLVAVGRRVRRDRDTFRPDPPHNTCQDRVARACDTLCLRFGLNLAMDGGRSWPQTLVVSYECELVSVCPNPLGVRRHRADATR